MWSFQNFAVHPFCSSRTSVMTRFSGPSGESTAHLPWSASSLINLRQQSFKWWSKTKGQRRRFQVYEWIARPCRSLSRDWIDSPSASRKLSAKTIAPMRCSVTSSADRCKMNCSVHGFKTVIQASPLTRSAAGSPTPSLSWNACRSRIAAPSLQRSALWRLTSRPDPNTVTMELHTRLKRWKTHRRCSRPAWTNSYHDVTRSSWVSFAANLHTSQIGFGNGANMITLLI